MARTYARTKNRRFASTGGKAGWRKLSPSGSGTVKVAGKARAGLIWASGGQVSGAIIRQAVLGRSQHKVPGHRPKRRKR